MDRPSCARSRPGEISRALEILRRRFLRHRSLVRRLGSDTRIGRLIASADPIALSSFEEGPRIGLGSRLARRLGAPLALGLAVRVDGLSELVARGEILLRCVRVLAAVEIRAGILALEIGLAELGACARARRRRGTVGGLHLGACAFGLSLEMLVQLRVELRSQRV